MKALRRGNQGPSVRRWQLFLMGQGFDPRGVDGIFGEDTETATIAFQRRHGLIQSGGYDSPTAARAGTLGFELVTDSLDDSREGPNFPPRPNFGSPNDTWRRSNLGAFRFVHEPTSRNPENIRILGDWVRDNIVSVDLPQLARIGSPRRSTIIRFHKKAADQLRAIWAEWDRNGLVARILTWHGSFVPRYQRGSTTKLSNHAFGAAFDINRKANKYGAIPALVGEPGSVRELVEIANQHGFFWGGHYRSRPDGMHFEVAKLL